MEPTNNKVTQILNHEMKNGIMTVQVECAGKTEWESLQDCMDRDVKVVNNYYDCLPDEKKDEFYEQMEKCGLYESEAFKEKEREWLRSGNTVARIGYAEEDSDDDDDNLGETQKKDENKEVEEEDDFSSMF